MKRTRKQIYDMRVAEFQAIYAKVNKATGDIAAQAAEGSGWLISMFLALASNLGAYISAMEANAAPLPPSLSRLQSALNEAIKHAIAAQVEIDLMNNGDDFRHGHHDKPERGGG